MKAKVGDRLVIKRGTIGRRDLRGLITEVQAATTDRARGDYPRIDSPTTPE
ncbi:DUF1918 domain-containing protein [Mycobacterium sp. 852002-50816_SCH5313054-b]|uniref:DUF1918 domain-containing protein n=1 Tax=Mycobacterium sp. 852002-50816_SCH5313054-b TaxID=1834092 RepID=UPI000A9D7349|nr:DUF1918 domain-containing protein [Mycobacterium sp. 852002-50816_SCH5313054-b]